MPKDQTGGAIIILLVLILIAIVGFGGYYIGAQNSSPKVEPSPVAQTSTQTSASPTPSPAAQSTSTLPSGWTYQEDKFCNVSIPVPPKSEPYYIPDNPNTPPSVTNDEGGWWHFEKRAYEPSPTEKFFTNDTMAIFKQPEAASDHVPGFVQVICGSNNKNYTTASYVEDYKKQFTDGTFGGLNFEEVGTKTLWGKQVIESNITGGMYSGDDHEYYFVTPSKVYRIRKLSYSQLQIIKDTTNQIFDNLKFSN